MHILGLSCYYHDAAAVILRDGVLVAAAEEERFSRVKHDHGFPEQAIAFCLRQAGIQAGELDHVVFYEKPFVKFERLVKTILQTAPRSGRLFREAMGTWFADKLWVRERICRELDLPRSRVAFTDHHQSHAASAFYCSPFDEAAVLTIDGVGEWACGTVGWGRGTRLHLDQEIRFPHSPGLLYSAFTAFLGFEVNEGEYKVMGMAAYGRPRHVDKIRRIVRVYDDGSIWLDLDYFAFHHSTRDSFNRKFIGLFGPPRDPRAETLDPYYCDLAASIQAVTEEIVLGMARHALKTSGLTRLCHAGGVALNSVANARLLRELPLEGLFVQPAAGDSGGALGAALYFHHAVLGHPRRFVMEHAFWGPEHSPAQIEEFLLSSRIPFTRAETDDALLAAVAQALQQGQVVGWFQGRAEWGPRALGHRSILADPRPAAMKDTLNAKIKFRESFRPFAPSVLAEQAGAFFDLPQSDHPARFMLDVAGVKADKREAIQAVTHVDGTGRVQTVYRDASPLYYRLIERFGEATGIPMIVNTSFNLRGEPIVNTPREAFSTFSKSGMDLLVLGHCLIRK
jgi:carbamoyltransferase